MNAWLLTWLHPDREPGESIAAILSSRKGEQAIADLMEFLVLQAKFSAQAAAHVANRPKERVYNARRPIVVNRVPHGDRIFCGRDPLLYGRKVTNLVVTLDQAESQEVVAWREPDDYRFTDQRETRVVVAKSGELRKVIRPNEPLALQQLRAG